MKKISFFTVMIVFVLLVTGCTITVDTVDSVDTPLYSGKILSIGVIGEIPKVREDQVHFTEITFDELEDYSKLSTTYDAVIIMKEHLIEADDNKYVKVYNKAGIPFFFIESPRSFMPFVLEDLSFEHSSFQNFHYDMYATGYFQTGTAYKSWGYGLYNDKINAPNVKDVYSRICTTIESIQNGTYQ